MRRVARGCLSPQEWTEWIDGAVPSFAREAYQRHIERCSRCRREYESLALAVRSLQELERDGAAPSPAFHLKVKRRLAWEKRDALSPLPRRRALWWVPVAAAGVLLLSAGLWTWRPGLPGKAQAYVELYAEAHLRAEALAAGDLAALVAGRGEMPW